MRKMVLGVMAACVALATVSTSVRAQQEANPQAGTLTTPGGDSNFDPNQPIKPGFDVSVTVSSAAGVEADLSGTFKVDPSGAIIMKIIGPVTVGGLTASQAADLIAGKAKVLIKDPTVKVAIVSVPKPTILISGATIKPGSNPVNVGTTLAEALTVFGYTENADLSRVRVIRKDPAGKTTVTEYNFMRWLRPAPGQAPDESMNPVLADKDFLFIPPKNVNTMGNVKVEGVVQRPGVVPLDFGQPTKLREALSRAGGLTPAADRRQVSVRRMGQERPFVFDYDRVEAGDPVQNIDLMPDDIVYVQNLGVEQFINLNGPFVRSGKLPYTRALTLTQAVAEGGGFAPTAKKGDGVVYRHPVSGDPTKTQIIAFNYDKIRKNQQPDIRLEPGDTVEVAAGSGPRPPMTGLELAQSLLSIALIVDRIFSGGSRY